MVADMNRNNPQTTNIGQLGEDYATSFLISQNYQIIARNFHCRFGEIDVIAFDQNAKQLVFVEVKTRTDQSFGEPQEAVNFIKKRKMLRTINQFFEKNETLDSQSVRDSRHGHAYHPHSSWRIDVIAVKLKPPPELAALIDITHFKNFYG